MSMSGASEATADSADGASMGLLQVFSTGGPADPSAWPADTGSCGVGALATAVVDARAAMATRVADVRSVTSVAAIRLTECADTFRAAAAVRVVIGAEAPAVDELAAAAARHGSARRPLDERVVGPGGRGAEAGRLVLPARRSPRAHAEGRG